MADRLKGKIAIVTGGASGIGEATCRFFAAEGVAGLVIADLNTESAEALAKELAAGGCDAVGRGLDTGNEELWPPLVAEVESRYGRLDVLVNCAGRGGPMARPVVHETTVEGWETTFQTNSRGVLLGMKHGIPLMLRGGGGSIINVVSIYAVIGDDFGTAYAASKGAVRTLTRTAAIQYAKQNIRVNGVFPGFVETPMTRELHKRPGVREKRTGLTPLGRLATPEDIAWGILFLATDEAAYMTGSEPVIDGGVSAW